MSWVDFGFVARAHGVKGELRIVLHSPEVEVSSDLEEVRLVPKVGSAIVIPIMKARTTDGALLMTLGDIKTREDAASWKGSAVQIDSKLLPPLDPAEYYLYELVGTVVIDESEQVLGTVRRLFDNAGQVLMEIDVEGASPKLLPCVSEFLLKFDRSRMTTIVRVPDGLWDC